jgi:hypothetical protein
MAEKQEGAATPPRRTEQEDLVGAKDNRKQGVEDSR